MTIGFIAVGIFILLSACINFINLQTAQSLNRAREVSIRKVMGGTRTQLVVQFLVETAILTFISFLFALWITELALQSWNGLLTIARMDMQLDWSVVGFGLALIGFVTLVAGLYPALKLSSFQPSEALKSGFSLLNTKRNGLNLRQILVVAQFVITQTLIIGSIVISFQMNYFLNKDLGFNKEGVLTIRTYTPDVKKINRLVQGLESIPEISSFSLNSGPPLDGGRYGTSFQEVGYEEKGDINAGNKFVDHRYLDNYEIDLVAGRHFRSDEIGDSIGGFVVNEALVQLLEVDNPHDAIGKMISCYGRKAPIIGVTKDYHTDSFNQEISPTILLPLQRQINGADVKLSVKDFSNTLSKLRPIWLEVFPNRAFEFRSVNDTMLEIYIVEDIMLKCVRIFSLIAIIIGCLGLYGLVSFLAIKKTKEIGIRKVLGANYGQILYIFSRRFVILVIIAFVISVPVAYLAMEAWLGNYAYRIELGWTVFALGFVTTISLTAITTGYISMKAARTNPADTLQFE